jgi:hypothetical protein
LVVKAVPRWMETLIMASAAKKRPAAKKAVAKKRPAAKKAVAKKRPAAKKAVAKKRPAFRRIVEGHPAPPIPPAPYPKAARRRPIS